MAHGTAKSFDLSKQDSKVEFVAIGKPNFLKIHGTGGKAIGAIELDGRKSKANIRVLLNDFATGIALRDEHMKDKYLETKKFPEAVLIISDLTLEKDPMIDVFNQKQVSFKGTLIVHGTESEIEGKADIESTKSGLIVNAKTKTNISAHKIALPTYIGVKVADEIQISAELIIKK